MLLFSENMDGRSGGVAKADANPSAIIIVIEPCVQRGTRSNLNSRKQKRWRPRSLPARNDTTTNDRQTVQRIGSEKKVELALVLCRVRVPMETQVGKSGRAGKAMMPTRVQYRTGTVVVASNAFTRKHTFELSFALPPPPPSPLTRVSSNRTK